MSQKIQHIKAREILDSRGTPTVECDIILESGIWGRAAVPSGASTGKFEAVELRDEDPKRFQGKGVLKAIHHIVETIAPALRGFDVTDQEGLDRKILSLDPSPQKDRLGANATLAVSMAATRTSSLVQKTSLAQTIGQIYQNKTFTLPVPFMNIVNGGAHADNTLDFQEFMIAPVGAKSFSEALRMGAEVFQTLMQILKKQNLSIAVGDEGGFAPRFKSHEEALQMISEAIQRCGYAAEIRLALDVAASSFFCEGKYQLKKSGKGTKSADEMIAIYENLCHEFPIVSIEDGLDEEDWRGWRTLTEHMPNTQLVGDDLFVTQSNRLERGIKERCGNAILIKLNQIGTVTETLETMKVAVKNGYNCMVSHRSGETEDTFIADLAVGTNAGQIKTGSLCRTDRTAKYNQLLRLEEELKLSYAKLK